MKKFLAPATALSLVVLVLAGGAALASSSSSSTTLCVTKLGLTSVQKDGTCSSLSTKVVVPSQVAVDSLNARMTTLESEVEALKTDVADLKAASEDPEPTPGAISMTSTLGDPGGPDYDIVVHGTHLIPGSTIELVTSTSTLSQQIGQAQPDGTFERTLPGYCSIGFITLTAQGAQGPVVTNNSEDHARLCP